MTSKSYLNLVLLHENMVNKNGEPITTSLTMIDIHDIARSSKTYNLQKAYIAHPSPTLRKLGLTLKKHWEDGYGSTYNPKRKDALDIVEIASNLEECIAAITEKYGSAPKLIATSAKPATDKQISFSKLRNLISENSSPILLMLGTGWGMSEELLTKADFILEPINGPGEYNHLSVRSAAAILLDRLVAER